MSYTGTSVTVFIRFGELEVVASSNTQQMLKTGWRVVDWPVPQYVLRSLVRIFEVQISYMSRRRLIQYLLLRLDEINGLTPQLGRGISASA